MNFELKMLPEHDLKGHLSEKLSDVVCNGEWSLKRSHVCNSLPSKF